MGKVNFYVVGTGGSLGTLSSNDLSLPKAKIKLHLKISFELILKVVKLLVFQKFYSIYLLG